MYVKTINLPCAGNKVFVKRQTQGGSFNPNPPLRTPLVACHTRQKLWNSHFGWKLGSPNNVVNTKKNI